MVSRVKPAAQQLSLFDTVAPAAVQPAVAGARFTPPQLDDVLLHAVPDAPPNAGGSVSKTRLLQARMCASAGATLRLIITNNRHTLLSWRLDEAGERVVRAHHMFLDASAAVATALGHWVMGGRQESPNRAIDDFMASHRHLVTRERRPLTAPRGQVHDLGAIMAQLNQAQFANAVEASIGWGEPGAPKRRQRQTIQLGCYDPDDQAIVIHPALDQDFVPRFFVESVVFHEMLHQQVPATVAGERRCVHNAQFRAREDAFSLTAPALEWQRANLARLLSFSRQPSPAPLLTASKNRRSPK